MSNYNDLPDNLPIPKDDGACDHLTGMALPDINLNTTSNTQVNLSELSGKTVFVFLSDDRST